MKSKKQFKIAIIGTGYVGLSNAVLLSQHNEVVALDIQEARVALINDRQSPITDHYIEEYLSTKQLHLLATTDKIVAYKDADFIIVATPTNYDVVSNYFDTSLVESVIADATNANSSATIIIKSTVPVGYTEKLQKQYPDNEIFFSPEFLREGKALYDNLYPSRIIVGGTSKAASTFASLLTRGAIKADIPTLLTSSTEAEAIKLFANTFLAMRIAYFNELDTYSEVHGLSTKDIIKGISLDPRIGDYYNNPSFGYGGYCLPKDTKQMVANYGDIPNKLITAVVEANETRIAHIANMIMQKNPTVVGIYRLAMKMDSDNFRQSSIQGVIKHLLDANVRVVIYEPSIDANEYQSIEVVDELEVFKKMADVIVANRLTPDIIDMGSKVYTRDLFGRD